MVAVINPSTIPVAGHLDAIKTLNVEVQEVPQETAELDMSLDVFGEIMSWFGVYTPISLFYALPADFDHSTLVDLVTSRLNAGFEKLVADFPWVAGQVVRLPKPDHEGRLFRVRGHEKYPGLVIKDNRNDADVPSMAELKAKGYPINAIPETWLAPVSTVDFHIPIKPVMMFQATLLKDAVILTTTTEHQVMDFVGQGNVMALLDKACNGLTFTAEELDLGSRDRRQIWAKFETAPTTISAEVAAQLEAHQTGVAPAEQVVPEAPKTAFKTEWANFSITGTKLDELKAEASSHLTRGFISTDDALSALLWQSVARARAYRYTSDSPVSLFRAINSRRYLDLPYAYPGIVVSAATASIPFAEMQSTPLGQVAALLREKVDPKTSGLREAIGAWATALLAPKDRPEVDWMADIQGAGVLGLSSWAVVDCYNFDFGFGLGKPDIVVRPMPVPLESMTHFMPRAPNGDGIVSICLREEEMKALREDPGFAKYCVYRG